MDYDDAEEAGRDRQEESGTPTLAQWARAEAVKALLSSGTAPADEDAFEDRVHYLARTILGV
jgi:hypothetical protein